MDGVKICDEQIKEYLCEAIAGDGFPYGYNKLTAELREKHGLIINEKKVYRLCKELGILRPQRKIQTRHPRRLARRDTVTGPNQLWQMDIKYGYIPAQGTFFFQLSIIDVFDRSVKAYHLGLSCTAANACWTLKEALRTRGIGDAEGKLKVRTDNGPRFTAHIFEQLCEDRAIVHERIPVKTPNLNAYIESFHSILEAECYSQHEFGTFQEVYGVIADYMVYYNERPRHGSLRNKSPKAFRALLDAGRIVARPFAA